MCIYMYIYIYIYRSGDSRGHRTFLAPSAEKQTCNYDTECANY